jgi:gamma-glutamylcyclotransferase
MMNCVLYFAFGSNMDREQMNKRAPQAEYVGVGYVPDHDLVFNRKGSYRPGGVASIVPASGARAYGVVWAISPAELAEMDRIEDPRAYERVQKTVITTDGKELLCNVYIAFPQGDIPADQPYLELIIKAAQTASLPPEWIDRIKKYRTT